jgi:phosphatidylinositol alpha-1,6-mannosyltransferase
VLFVTNDFGPRAGGIETFVIGLIERLPFGTAVIYTSSQGDTAEYDRGWLEKHGAEIIRDRAKILLPTPRVAMAVKKIAKEKNISIASFGAAAPLGLLASSLRKAGVKKIVALTHGHEVWWAKVFPFSFGLRKIGNDVDVLTYLGEFTRSAISKPLTSRAQRAMVKIAPGIDTDHFAPSSSAKQLREELGLSQKSLIVCVGRLVHRKGQDRLIEAMPSILATNPNAHLLFVGEGPYLDTLKKLVGERNLEKAVTFVGRVQYDQLPRYICAGDIFAMPSRSRFFGLEVEGLGIVYLEASACGVPVIAGNSGGAPDAVIDGTTGLVVDGIDVEEIADACAALLEDPDRARAMGAAGRRWAINTWRWEIWALEFERLLLTD